jgi:hypothetical protein
MEKLIVLFVVRFAFVLLLTVGVGCASHTGDRPKRSWANLYAADPDLAGVIVLQNHTEPDEPWRSKTMHPAVVMYVFWNGRVLQYQYSRHGKLEGRVDWKLDKTDYDWWSEVDYSYGSDPEFRRHKDPRQK